MSDNKANETKKVICNSVVGKNSLFDKCAKTSDYLYYYFFKEES